MVMVDEEDDRPVLLFALPWIPQSKLKLHSSVFPILIIFYCV